MEDSQKYRETYPVDPHEISRLISQDRGFTKLMPAIFSDEEWRSFGTVVDLGCGPGGWCLDMAKRHPDCFFIGVDNSQEMLNQARLLALGENVQNVSFRSMDIRKRLHFEENSVGYVNSRLMALYLTKQNWPPLLREVYRILRPGGKVLVTDHEAIYSTSEALERLNALLLSICHVSGLTFSPTGRSTGFSAHIQQLLRGAGFGHTRCQAFAIDGSFGQPDRDEWVENIFLMSHTFRPFVLATGMTTNEEIQSLLDQAMKDAHDPQFGAFAFHLMAWAEKMAEGNH